MIKKFDYANRRTRLEYLTVTYALVNEKGAFMLYDVNGKLHARGCRYPFSGTANIPLQPQSLAAETKYHLSEHIPGIYVLRDTEVCDYLVDVNAPANMNNVALYVLCSKVLLHYGYGKQIPISVDQSKLAWNIDRRLQLCIEHNCLIYEHGIESNYGQQLREVFSDLDVKQYQRMG